MTCHAQIQHPKRSLQFLPPYADTRAFEPEYDPNVSPGIQQAIGRCRAMDARTECQTCGGHGQVQFQYVVPICCWSPLPNGACCGNPVPQVETGVDVCPDCGGTGATPEAMGETK